MKFNKSVLFVGVVGALALTSQSQATVIIDDWNVNQTVISVSTSPGVSDTQSRLGAANGGNFWGVRGDSYAHLVAGDDVETVDCANCEEGHGTSGSNSVGNGFWQWQSDGNDLDVNGGMTLYYDADVAGGDIVATFVGDTTQEVWWSDIAAGPLSLYGSLVVDNVTSIYIDWFSVGGVFNPNSDANYGGVVSARDFGIAAERLDFNIDNFVVSTPATMALLGLGLIGLGYRVAKY
jgi:hypothetical protein